MSVFVKLQTERISGGAEICINIEYSKNARVAAQIRNVLMGLLVNGFS